MAGIREDGGHYNHAATWLILAFVELGQPEKALELFICAVRSRTPRSAGWLYRAGLEWILGFRLQGDHFTLKPCIPAFWPGYQLTFRYRASIYHITVENRSRSGCPIQSMEMDGQPLEGNSIRLTGTTGLHHVTVIL